ncbi:Panacea domain-containing protein [Pseudomonas aeruginosa]|nr:Panacea domain-containing protein [Pseudomonas aeruginosa]
MARFDVPMSDDRAVSMPHGPVLSSTLDLIKGRLRSEVWSAWISPLVDHEVRLVHDVENWDDLDELSRSDRSILESVWQEFGHMTKYQLRDYTHHHIGEWHDPTALPGTLIQRILSWRLVKARSWRRSRRAILLSAVGTVGSCLSSFDARERISEGNSANPHRGANHLHFVMNDPVYCPVLGYDAVLLVNISTVYPDKYFDQSCILKKGCHPFVLRDSWVVYREAGPFNLARLEQGVAQKSIKTHQPINAGDFTRIRAGFDISPDVKIKVERFMRQHKI